jgi:hypothetical protein
MDDIKAYIEKELHQLAETFIRQRVASLTARKIVASGELKQSLAYEIQATARREAVELLLAFEEHGRFIDMKTLRPPQDYGQPYITLLEEWIRKRGWEQKFIAKFMQSRKLRTVPKNVLNQIAWGIAIKRGQGKYRRKKWYNSAKTAFTYEVFNKVVAGLPELTAKTIKQAFK